ncbi:MAG: FecCD family ABC transporter permease [Caulobacterales bacterium]|jgi:iron complex transport system permease protein
MKDAGLNSGLAGLAALAMFIALLVGSTPMLPVLALHALLGQGDAATLLIVWEIRLPRAIAAFLVGGALGLSGAALQGLLRNPLADPGVLGVSATAALAATVTLYFGVAQAFIWAMPIAAVAGAMAATGLLAVTSIRMRSVVTLILIGVGLSSLAGALMALMMNFAPNPFSLSDMVNWMLGTVANRSLVDIAFALPFLIVGAGLLLFGARGLSALTLGEEAAHGIGLDLARARLGVVVGTGLVTGGAVSLAGAIGFVGLVAPHVVRSLVGHDPGRTLVPAALLGGLILVVADILVRIIATDSELKLGVVAALIGAPAFIWIAAQRRGADG